MDPQASDELKQAIVEHGLNKNHNDWYEIEERIRDRARGVEEKSDVLDYYLKRDDCPKEFFVPAVQDCMGKYFDKYYRNTEYYVDAERLNEIVAHPNMTEEAFTEALYIVREDMVNYAEDPEEVDGPYYQGRDDTCDLIRKDKQQILQTMLKNPACTPEIMVEVFRAAEEIGLLETIRDSKNQYQFDEDKWDVAELLYEREKVGQEEFEKREQNKQVTSDVVLNRVIKYSEEQIKEEVEKAFSRVEAKKEQLKTKQNEDTAQEIAVYEKSRENRPPTTLDEVVKAKISSKKQNQ